MMMMMMMMQYAPVSTAGSGCRWLTPSPWIRVVVVR